MENTAHARDYAGQKLGLLGYNYTNNTTCSTSGGNQQSLVSDGFVLWSKGRA